MVTKLNKRICSPLRGSPLHLANAVGVSKSVCSHIQDLWDLRSSINDRDSFLCIMSADGNTECTEVSRRQGDCHGECASRKMTTPSGRSRDLVTESCEAKLPNDLRVSARPPDLRVKRRRLSAQSAEYRMIDRTLTGTKSCFYL